MKFRRCDRCNKEISWERDRDQGIVEVNIYRAEEEGDGLETEYHTFDYCPPCTEIVLKQLEDLAGGSNPPEEAAKPESE